MVCVGGAADGGVATHRTLNVLPAMWTAQRECTMKEGGDRNGEREGGGEAELQMVA